MGLINQTSAEEVDPAASLASNAKIVANWRKRLECISEELAGLTAGKAGSLPNAPGGQDHATYKRLLLAEQKELLDSIARLEGPSVYTSYGAL